MSSNETYVLGRDFKGDEILSDEPYNYILFQGELIRFEGSDSDKFLLLEEIGGKLLSLEEIKEEKERGFNID